MAKRSAAHFLLEGLVELGIEHIFANLGTDHVSLIEEIARWEQEGRPHPKVILCPHEVVAVHMAGGYALATGRGQAVLVHVDAGTANATMAIQNLFRARLPVLVMAGRAPFTLRGELRGSRDTYVHFVQDPFDIASIVRPYVRWEYTLPSGVVAKEALSRAHAFMSSDPPGPVYLLLPRETLAEEIEESAVASFPASRFGAVKRGGVDAATVATIAEALMTAERPIAIASYLGRNPLAVSALEALARECGIAVADPHATDLNLPHDHPCYLGPDPAPLIAQADLGLLLDTDVPFLPPASPAAARLRWVQIDRDALKADFPMWGFATDLRIEADCASVLADLRDAVRARADDAFRRRVAQRLAAWEPLRQARRERLAKAAANPGPPDAITVPHLCALLGEKLRPDDIVLNEAIRNTLFVQEQIPRTKPLSYVGLAGGGLGFSGGMALGMKLARPEARVVQIIGDGGFHFSAPDSVYAVAQNYRLPIFTVVLDNRGWQAVKSAVQRVYPQGAAAKSELFQSRLDSGRQGEERRFEDVARAFGAHGERVRDAADLPAALDRCLAALDRGQAAVLVARVTPL